MPIYKGLERFRLVEKMGDGAFSNVYKAIDLDTKQKVAVKVVRKYELNATQAGDKHLNPQLKKRQKVTERANILKEVQIMRGIDHPSIVKLISFSESPEHYFLTLELMEGGELFHQIVKLTYFSEHLSRHVILQVAKGIRYLHEERGVVHRDIKPENILFERIPIIPSKNSIHRPYDEEKEDEGDFIDGVGGGGIGRVKIADFGLSKVVWDEQTMTPCGTVGYTAPEIVKDERYSKSVDMWALGCVLYTLLCGFPPFYDESINVLTEKVARGYYTFLSPWWDDISASSKDLITHLLCVDPRQRYSIDEFLAHPWCNEPRGQVAATPALRTHYDPLLLPPGARDGRSPGVATLKEAFDITYAVHRMEEEGARRRAYNGAEGAGARGFLGGLNEEGEEDDDEEVMEEVAKKHGQQAARVLEDRKYAAPGVNNMQAGAGHRRMAVGSIADGRAGVRDQGMRGARQRKGEPANTGFALDMGNATLLGRRHRRVGEPSPLGYAAAPAGLRKAMSPEPMQLD
jgi:serine/threonine protein kinase